MQLEDIKIAILGTTGAGKTSYLLGMYAVMQTGMQGFTIAAKDMDVDLDLTERWEQLIAVKGEDRWPAPNAATMEQYGFDFSYGFRNVMGFEWLDYRGLALSDLSSEQDVRGLTNYLGESGCLFLCISGEHLLDRVTPNTVRDMKSDRMNQFIQQYISNRYQPTVNKPFPIVIIITKYDLCQHREKQDVIEDIKKLFQALFTPDSGWLVMICPVSLGTELSNDRDSGSIVPVNVHLPIVFAVYAQVRAYGIKLKERRNQIYEALETEKKTLPLLKFFKYRELQDQATRLQDCEAAIATVEENMQLLARELQQVSLFLSGSEVSANV
jgi:GTPase SAR1 family protein